MDRWLNNRVENSHLPFRQRELDMQRFSQMKTLQKFSAVHAAFHNHFNQDHHLHQQRSLQSLPLNRLGRVARARHMKTNSQGRSALNGDKFSLD